MFPPSNGIWVDLQSSFLTVETPMKEERSKAKIWNLSLKSWKERALNDTLVITLVIIEYLKSSK